MADWTADAADLIERTVAGVRDKTVEPVQFVGDRAAIAIEHARLYEAERAARVRLENLQQVTDAALAHRIIERCFQKGLLFFAPVGVGGGCVKIAPPLCITADALRDGLTALGEAVDEAVAELSQ